MLGDEHRMGFVGDGAFDAVLAIVVERVERRFGKLPAAGYAAVVAAVARTGATDGGVALRAAVGCGRLECGDDGVECATGAGLCGRDSRNGDALVDDGVREIGGLDRRDGVRSLGFAQNELTVAPVVGENVGVNTLRNREARKKRKARLARRREGNGASGSATGADHGVSVAEEMEQHAEVYGLSVSELDAADFEKGHSVGVFDVATKTEMKGLAKQRLELYRLRNEREKLRLQREIEMEKATLEAGANVARVNNWITEVKSGNSKSDGMSKGSSSSGRVTRRSAWSGGSWRSRPRSDETKGSSFVPEEVYNAVVARVAELEEKEKELVAKYERAKDARYDALNHTFRILDQRADVGMLTVADRAKCGKV